MSTARPISGLPERATQRSYADDAWPFVRVRGHIVESTAPAVRRCRKARFSRPQFETTNRRTSLDDGQRETSRADIGAPLERHDAPRTEKKNAVCGQVKTVSFGGSVGIRREASESGV